MKEETRSLLGKGRIRSGESCQKYRQNPAFWKILAVCHLSGSGAVGLVRSARDKENPGRRRAAPLLLALRWMRFASRLLEGVILPYEGRWHGQGSTLLKRSRADVWISFGFIPPRRSWEEQFQQGMKPPMGHAPPEEWLTDMPPDLCLGPLACWDLGDT